MARTCFQLLPSQLAAKFDLGYVVVTGPFALEADCLVSCSGSGSGSSSGSGSGTPNLVGYWPLNEGFGTTAHDLSGHGNDLALQTNTSWDSDTPGSQAGSGGSVFVDVGGSLTCPTMTGLPLGASNITVAFWLKPGAIGGGISFQYGVSNTSGFIRNSINRTIFQDDNQSVTAPSEPPASVSVWSFYTLVWFSSTTWALYLNGTIVAGGSVAFALNTGAGGTISLLNVGGGCNVKDVRVYDSDAIDIMALYLGTLGP